MTYYQLNTYKHPLNTHFANVKYLYHKQTFKNWCSPVIKVKTKQDYITRRLLCREIVVQGNPRVYKALRNELNSVLEELKRLEAGQSIDGELLETIRLISTTLDGMRED